MARHITKLIILFWLTLFCTSFSAQASLFDKTPSAGKFVSVDQAFAFDFSQNNQHLILKWDIAPGYYLYQHQIKIEAQDATIAPYTFPTAEKHNDAFYGDTLIYKHSLSIPLTLSQAKNNSVITVSYQGCAEAGFCYPPETRTVPLSEITTTSNSVAITSLPPQTDEAKSEESLPFSPLWALVIGIIAAATPCVLPMYPLISSIILGNKQSYSLKRTFFLAFVYVQGMALTYTALGIVVAAAGMQFQAYFQHPVVLIGLSALFILLALSMFGVYTLQLPSSLQTKMTGWSNNQKGGSPLGVFIMGALAGLISSPCTTAPLTAILLYIAQSGNLLAGGGTLYLYALGMGIPLILVTLFGNKVLPRSGPWMQYVKEGFGFLILALPVILLGRLYGEIWELRMWSALGLAFFGWAFIVSLRSQQGWIRLLQLLLLAAALIVTRPLQDWAFSPAIPQAQADTHSLFTPVSDSDELHQALVNAKGKIVMLDLYADWCVTCKEFEKYTFSAPSVQNALSDAVLLQADVTANNRQHIALLKEFQVLGLPTILFFDQTGRELTGLRVSGFMNAEQFVEHIEKIKKHTAQAK
ncbi:protein-disulfide reductase DsbD [Budviciaceae bacterium BWR-B9]|uniref:Thiol:disulfide interchange protein DsbD n=1 Tax=Limnobaculum allomyrinae TaxID=2791986 RepID=A0ABS1IVC7_9GAMM|nr:MULTISPECIES: protein-disulfide reductase DsbD [Limnobaculum]MBK5145703.1 protein-disulfide reductase DsbD [Limnobaculum allomyrinae]MBV7693763.1 protein-disulfide reductase DsbD [Limnobaculum sp. M2-1]